MAKDIRKIENPIITLEDEILNHSLLWRADTRFRRLPTYLKEVIESTIDAVSISKSTADIEIEVGGDDGRKNIETKKFIAIYRKRYLEFTDFECEETFNGVAFVIIGGHVKKLIDAGSSVEEYLIWFFDDFLKENPKFCPPSSKTALSIWVYNKFLFKMKDKLRVRKKDAFNSGKRLKLMKIASEVFKDDSSQELGEIILKMSENKISFTKALSFIKEHFKEKNIVEYDSDIKNIEGR